MPKPNGITAKQFANFLLTTAPYYDKMIMRDMVSIKLIRRDVWRLPNELRGLFKTIYFDNVEIKVLAKRLFPYLKKKKRNPMVRAQYRKASDLIWGRVHEWIDSLPESERDEQLSKRETRDWIGMVPMGMWPGLNEDYEQKFSGVFKTKD